MPIHSLKIGLIGAGRIGNLHAEHLTSRIRSAEVVIVADALESVARQCAGQHTIANVTDDYHTVLARPDVRAVLICTPTDTHAQMIEEAAHAGKHIFCEKPIALDLPSIDRALQAVKRAGVKLQIGFNRRFDVNFRRMRTAVEHGEIGQPQQFHIISRDPQPPPLAYIRASGGIFLDMTIHDFDMVRFLMNSDIEEIFALGSVMINPAIAEAGDVDNAIVTLRLANGVTGTISNSRQAAYGYDQRVEILGRAGAIHMGNTYPNTTTISDSKSIWRDLPQHFFVERYAQSFLAEMTGFVKAVLNDTPVPVTGQDGRIPVAVALAAQRSLVERRPVHLREVEYQVGDTHEG